MPKTLNRVGSHKNKFFMKTKINNARRLLPCWLRVTSMMILSLLSIGANAQVATFGAPGVAGSPLSNCGPVTRTSASSNEDFSQHYYLYTAADMAAAGVLPGSTITSIRWFKANNGATAPGNLSSIWRVHMKNSATLPSPVWCSPSYAVQSAGATLVYNNTSQVIPNTVGWFNLPLSTPFVYTGGSLEIGSSWNCSLFTGNPTTNGITWNQYLVPNANQTFGARGTSGSLVMINESCSPISQLVFTPPAPCITVSNIGNTVSSVATTCPSAPFNLTLQFPPPAVPGIDYVWESADDYDFTTNVLTLGTGSAQTAFATAPKYYRCQVTCTTVPITAVSTPVFVDVFDPVSVYAAGIDLSCHGDNQGEIYLSVSGGSGTYNYIWSDGTTGSSVSGLSSGTYSVIVTDGNGCTATTSATLAEPSALVLTSVVTNVSAFGMNDGSIQLNAVGGTPPYEYSIDAGATWNPTNVFAGLNATLYHCRVRDANGCITALDVTVNYSSPFLVDNSIFIDVTDDQDSIAHIVWGMPTSFSAFTYQLERSDDGVNFMPVASINTPALVNIMSLPTSSLNAFGSIMFTTEMQPRLLFNEVVQNLSPNTTRYYRVKMMNQTQSMVVYTQTKQFLPPPVLYQPWPILNPIPCPPVGLPPLGYTPTPWTSTQLIGCCLITKRLYVKYGCANPMPCTDCLPACNCKTDPCCMHNCTQYLFCGCTPWNSCGVATQYIWVVINSIYTAPVINTTQTNVSCNGGSNGSITILGAVQFCKRNKIIGAPPCYAATHPLPWPNALGQISNVFSGLCAGCYTIMVKDCNGCTATKVVCITQPPAITLTATAVNSCACTGSITVNATGGTPCVTGYTYQKLPSGIPQSSNVFTNLCAGCYTIKVTDCNGCFKTIVKCVTGSAFNLQPILVDPCFGTNNGSICIAGSTVVSTNNPCLKYAIGTSCTPLATTVFTSNPCFTNLPAGFYCIKIVDTCTGCDTCICVTLTNSNTPCGKTNNIIVNTGYDPITGLAIVPNGVPDPLWTVTAVGGAVFGPVNTVNIPAWAVHPVSHAIGFVGDPAGQRTYRRTFKMCSCDSITFNLNIAYDNWINGIYIDGVLITVPPTITPVAQQGWTSNFTVFHNFTFTRYLCAGTHTIDIRVVNLGGPSGMNLFGTVTGTSNSIVTNVSPVNCCCSCTIFQATPSVTNVSCNGGNTGSVCITSPAATNTACWKYSIGSSCTNMSTTSTTNPCFNGLPAGNYCVKITDTCSGCDTCICVSILNQSSPIQLTSTASGTCTCTGTITVNAAGSSCPAGSYTYQILPTGMPQTSNVFTGLCPGCYTILVTDCAGCTATIVECVPIIGYLFSLNATVTGAGCNGANTGSVCITSSTGVLDPCLKFRIGSSCTNSSGTFVTNPCFTGLAAGSYCIKVVDTCTGCDTCICVTVPQSPPLLLTATSVNSCSCNGSITVNAVGGVICPTGYTYQLLPGGPIQLSNTFTGLCAGCYTIVVTDCNGCTASIVRCITASGSLTGLNATVINPPCNGGTGTICIGNTTGTVNPCLKYALATVNCQVTAASLFTTNPCFNGLPAGNYCVKITDTCSGCDTCICVTITQPSPIQLTATSVNSCSCNGSITVNAVGGTPCTTGYTYQLLPGGLPQASNTFTGLCAGCYTIVVTDCNGCTASIVRCITASGSLTGLNATVINPPCNGGTGSICIGSLTGTNNPCLKYALATVNCQVTAASLFTPNPCFTNLPVGNYCVKITDTCSGCDTCICVTITQPSPIQLTATSVNSCSCNGSITVNAVGGTPCATGYTYQLLPGGLPQASNTFTGLCAGCYTIVVTDCNGCTASIVRCITPSGSLTGLNATVINPPCNGGTGSICIGNTTGTVNPCLKYALATVNCQVTAASLFTPNPCFTNLPAGNYCVKITDTCSGCDTCICVTITQPSPIQLTATSVNSCSCNGSITVNAVGGTPCATGYTYQLLPGGLPQASNTFNGLCAGCYTIVVTDCNGCTASIVRCITASGSLTGLNATVINPPCNGGTGTICIGNTTGTVNPCLKYALATVNCQVTAASLFTSNPCFNGLPAGNYCVKITDTCSGCDTCICVTITQPSPIQLTATSVNSCSCNGSITVNAVGGTPCTFFPAYTYQIFPSGLVQASPTFTGLCAGCYTIVVTDCNGCTASIVRCITASGSLTGLNATVINPPCNGGTGTICIGNTTGTVNPCLKYALATVNCQVTAASLFTTNPCFNGLPAGNYCVKITDTCSGCDTCICVTITQPSPIQLTATSVNSCSCNGSITVNAIGGTPCAFFPAYTYQIFPSGLVQASPTFTGLCAGCYTIVVTDCNGCTASIVRCITSSGSLTGLNATVINPPCNGGTGTICIGSLTGTNNPCLKYALATVNCQVTAASLFTPNPCFTNLPAGNYCVKITDTCSGCDTCICVTITQPSPIQLTATSVNSCSCNGSITVNAVGGTPCATGYTYQLLPGGLPQASNTFNGLCAGCYTIVVTDCNGCTASIVRCITASGSLTGLNATVINPPCNGGTGTICIGNTTGTVNPCLKYALATVNCQVTAASLFTTNPCFNGLPAGNYCVKITDTCSGCDTCICVTITQPSPIQLTATSVNSCSCNGSITVNAVGGTPCATGYTYQLLPGGLPQASNTFTGLCAGCYTIVVTDCNGCTASIVRCITASGSLTGLNATVINPPCNGGTGTICIGSLTGTNNPCLKYALATVNCQVTAASLFTPNPCFTNLPAGNYCVKITDTCSGCDTCICVTITQPSPIQLTATSVNSCSCNGSITVNAVGGTPCTFFPAYTYQIFPSGLVQTSPTFTGLCAGCYTIVVTDCNGCTASIVRCITSSGSLTGLNATVINPPCNGGTGSICIGSLTGTNNPCLKYRIGSSCTNMSTTSTINPCFNGLPAGNYCVKITDTCSGCDTCICVTITQPSPIQLTATSVNSCSCNGSITVNAVGGTPCAFLSGYTYQLLPGGPIQLSNTFTGLCAGCYTIVVTDCNGCTASIVRCITASGSLTGLNATVINPPCNGGTGSICIGNTTGTVNPCLKYALATVNCQVTAASLFTPNPCFTNLPAGNYCVKITDTCSGCDTCICVTITQPSPIQLTATSVNSCSCNGSITVNAVGGTPCATGYTYQLLPGGLPQASNTFTGLCAGCYTIVVTDCNGCTASIVRCITASGSLTGLNATVINPPCNGGTGSICIGSLTGTNNPCLKYALATVNCQVTAASLFTPNPCFTNLPAGNYCVKITDTCSGCDTCICVTITQPSPIQLTATSVNSCSCNGSITVNAVGGTPCATGYTYQLLPGGLPQISNTFTGLCAGCYTIVVTDCNGCTASIVRCITSSGSLTGLNATVINPPCNGGTGTICIGSLTGTNNPCLKYALATVNCQVTAASLFTPNPCFTNLPAGNYCVKITDTCSGCDTCICVTITQPSPIQLTATSVNSCSCNGSITVNAVGGTPCATGYTYQLLPGGLPQASNTFTGLCAGCYTIVVTDCNGCTASIVRCITASGSLTGLNATVINPPCNGGTGSICIGNTTGTVNPCLKYALATVNCQVTAASLFTPNPCFTNLPAGNYCVKITDTCSGCDTCICVTITQPSPIQLTATSVNSCSCNGSITVNAVGGTPCATGYTYQLLPGGLPQASNTFTGLCAGCYTIVVTDCNGCTASIVRCITASGSLTGLNATVINPPCNGGTGSICIGSLTGTNNPCLKYALATVNCQVTAASLFTPNPCFTNLPAGNYCVKITDTCSGCDTCICVTITQPSPIQLTATSVNSCSCNGSITVNAVGGTPCTFLGGYTYQLLPGGLPQASNTFNGLCAGCYTIVVTDCNGCTASIVRCITASGSLTGLNATVINPPCNGGTGSICIGNTTGTVNPCLKYALATVNCQVTAASLFTPNPCFNGLPAGNYCVKITDTCSGCDTCICVTITQPSPIQLTATSVNSCSCNGSITVNAVGGSPCATGYTYQLLPGGLPQSSNTFTGLCAGCYTIVVTDCNGCTKTIVKCITPSAPIVINPIVINPLCHGDNNGQIILNTPFNPCRMYRIGTSCTDLTNPFTPNTVFAGLTAGTYCIKVIDTCTGCETCICVTLMDPPPIIVTTTGINTCPGMNNGTAIANPVGGMMPYTFAWSNGQTTQSIINLLPGVYTVIVTDMNGCTASATQVIGITPCNPVTVNIQAFIQGYYLGNSTMTPALFNQGTSSDNTLADEITVELHSATAPYSLVASNVAFLHTDGMATCSFNTAGPGLYYIVVKHRNSVQTWSSNPVALSSIPISYNFTNAASQAYGANMIEVEPGVWAFYSGDITQDENVDLSDLAVFENDALAFLYGYLATDITGDGTVDLIDVPIVENNINNFIYSVHP